MWRSRSDCRRWLVDMSESELSDDEFAELMASIEAESVAIGKHITSQLVAMRRSRQRWKKFRLLEIVCQACGRPVAEVMETDPYPVMLFSQVEESEDRGWMDLGRTEGLKQPIRQEARKRFNQIQWPLPEEEVTRSHVPIIAWCSCGRVTIDGAQMYQDLRDGLKRRVIRRDTRSG